LPSSQAREQDRKPREAYARPTYDPRPSQTHSPRTRDDSSSSSKQGSLSRSGSPGPLAPRPASTFSIASSEDIRTRVSRNSRRGSMASESSQRSVTSPVYPYGWPSVPPFPQVLPISVYPSVQTMPVMPQFPLDMPLLPPAAPFMRQQYSRSPSRNTSASRGTGQSRSAERPQHQTDRTSLPSSHRRSNSDDSGGHKPPPHSQAKTNPSVALHRPLSRHTHSSDASHRVSMAASPTYKKPYVARRQTAIS
jgi:hypothetical protein